MSAFDLQSEEAFETRIQKVSALFDCYGLDTEHSLSEKWLPSFVKFLITLLSYFVNKCNVN